MKMTNKRITIKKYTIIFVLQPITEDNIPTRFEDFYLVKCVFFRTGIFHLFFVYEDFSMNLFKHYRVPQSIIVSPRQWKYHFFTKKDVEMPHCRTQSAKYYFAATKSVAKLEKR